MDEHQVGVLLTLLQQSGWSIATPESPDDEEIRGFIIGTEEYVQSVLSHLPDDHVFAVERLN